MNYTIIPVTKFQQNCTILTCPETNESAIIDPGGDLELLLNRIKKDKIILTKVLVTHAHLDHVGAVAELAKKFNISIEGPHKDDLFWIDALPQQAQMFDAPIAPAFTPSRWLIQGDIVTFGNIELHVLHCPGHTPGHVVFLNKKAQLVLVGDVLFKGSIGRTDFPKGDHAMLINSIKKNLWPLDDAVQFIPGHGPMSTIGYEKRNNSFLIDA
ncbi:Hypothetical metal-binding enzyme, YcbL homolog [hydrothermal vent metagenome]|uniref:Hypothetical metal-binding enzyme, YcbL homolog n=1 Tax=hydrothermal vent metagenome TaxID=652676 RepID=A0A3B0Z5X7_9ZZZZ